MSPTAESGTVDHRTLPRRRGPDLDADILAAALAEIADHGYASVTMERVAARARASKASLYRRWPDVPRLVLDAVYRVMPDPETMPDHGSLREDCLALLRQTVDLLEGPAGAAMRGLLGDVLRDPAVAAEVRDYSRGSSAQLMREVVARAQRRGDCPPGVVSQPRLTAGLALLRQRLFFFGEPVDDRYLVEVVDEVVLPLLRPRGG